MESIKNKNHLIQLNFFSIDVNPSPLPLNSVMLTARLESKLKTKPKTNEKRERRSGHQVKSQDFNSYVKSQVIYSVKSA